MNRTLSPAITAFAVWLCLHAPAALAQTVSVSVTDLNPSGFVRSEAHAVSGGRQVGSGTTASGATHALLWRGSAVSAADLHPAGFAGSVANGVAISAQVGTGDLPMGADGVSHHHALLWTDTAASVVDLHPAGFTDTFASAVSGSVQVGYGTDAATGSPHALLWTGSAGSVTDLTPPGFSYAVATGASGTAQVGYGIATDVHALLWRGTADSVVDLNPAGFRQSFAQGASGGVQVGQGTTASTYHALLWNGTAGSAVDLNPSGCTASSAYAAAPGTQVGIGNIHDAATGYDYPHAFLWHGTANSAIDLHKSLPSGFNTTSFAYGVDGTESTATVVGYGAGSKGRHAFLWRISFLTLSGLSPAARLAGSGAFTLTVNGANFAPSSIVKWNGLAQPTQFVSASQLTATIPASLTASAGTAQITVTTPKVATSAAKTFTIGARPVLSSLSPSSKKKGSGAFTLTVNGTGFAPDSLVKWNGGTQSTTYVSASKLTAAIPASLVAAAGTAQVTVTTPHVATSGAKPFTITN